MKTLEKEAAQGGGEHIISLAQLFGCENEKDIEVFLEFNRKNYTALYGENDPDKVFYSFKKIGEKHGTVVDHCPGLS